MTLAARGLAIGYRGRVVGSDFAIAVTPGSVHALLGPNGSGKTTLLKTLLGLLPPRGGEVLLEGRPLAAWSPRERAARLAYVAQGSAPPFAFTVADWVLMGRAGFAGPFGRPRPEDHDAAAAAIRTLGLRTLAARPVTAISGGERQLACIARALAQADAAALPSPDAALAPASRTIVLDEPTASLDFGNQARVLQVVRRLADEGAGVLFTTHDPHQALRHADRALLMRDGRSLAEGTVAEVVTRPLLERLYGVAVAELVDAASGDRAFVAR